MTSDREVAGAVQRPVGARRAWPKFRATRWLDTTPEAMELEQARIVYGVQIQREKGGKWAHCHTSGEPLFFDSAAAASDAIDRLWADSRSEPAK